MLIDDGIREELKIAITEAGDALDTALQLLPDSALAVSPYMVEASGHLLRAERMFSLLFPSANGR